MEPQAIIGLVDKTEQAHRFKYAESARTVKT